MEQHRGVGVLRHLQLATAILLVLEAIYVGGLSLLFAGMEASSASFENQPVDTGFLVLTLGLGLPMAAGLAWSSSALTKARRGQGPGLVSAALLAVVAVANLLLTARYALYMLPIGEEAPRWFGSAEYAWVVGGCAAVLFISAVTAATICLRPRRADSSRVGG